MALSSIGSGRGFWLAPSRCCLNITFCFSAGKGPPGPMPFDLIEEVLGRGQGYATRDYTDIQPDRAARWTKGVIGMTLTRLVKPDPPPVCIPVRVQLVVLTP